MSRLPPPKVQLAKKQQMAAAQTAQQYQSISRAAPLPRSALRR
jgi:hypothetical protein